MSGVPAERLNETAIDWMLSISYEEFIEQTTGNPYLIPQLIPQLIETIRDQRRQIEILKDLIRRR